jgi:hypothetical protein
MAHAPRANEIRAARERILGASGPPRDVPASKTVLDVMEGKWPDSETDAEFRAVLGRISGCQSFGCSTAGYSAIDVHGQPTGQPLGKHGTAFSWFGRAIALEIKGWLAIWLLVDPRLARMATMGTVSSWRFLGDEERRLSRKKSPAAPAAAAPAASDRYFRRDQADGINGPDLLKQCTFAEHIVHARGKKTQYTSVSLDLSRIRDFGEQGYELNCGKVVSDGHSLVVHVALIAELQRVAREEDKEARLRAVAALRYAKKRKEGLVDWKFAIPSSLARKKVISWAEGQVQPYFNKV